MTIGLHQGGGTLVYVVPNDMVLVDKLRDRVKYESGEIAGGFSIQRL